MSSKSQHVVPNLKGGWSVRRFGSVRATRSFDTRAAAISFAKEKARKERVDLYIHRSDGMVEERRTFGRDPYPAQAKR
jgi:hypothetical protein